MLFSPSEEREPLSTCYPVLVREETQYAHTTQS